MADDLPPLPKGAVADQSIPPLPKGAVMDDSSSAAKPTGALANALAPVKAIPGAIANEFRSGQKQVKEGMTDAAKQYNSGSRSFLESLDVGPDAKMASGALQELFSPITGGAKALYGDPVRKQPDFPGKEFVAQTGEQALSMAAPGALSKSFGAMAKAMPKFSASVQKLMNEGINLTPGQLMQGMFKRAEDSLSSVPFLGDIIKNGQYSSLKDFNRATINRSLKEVGEKLPDGIEPGRKSIAYAEKTIGDKYDSLLPKLTLKPDSQFLQDSTAIEQRNIKGLPEPLQKQWSNIWEDATDRITAGAINGRAFKQIDSELGYIYRDYSRSPDPAHRTFARSVNDLRGALRANLERSNPKYAGELNKINTAWAAFSRVQAASINRAKSAGIFSPADMLTSIKRQSTRGEFARGDAMLQDLAEAANEVLPANVPDSGTVRRALTTEAAIGGVPFILGHPEVAVGGAAAALPYTKPGMAAVNKVAKSAPTALSGANKALGLTGPAASAAQSLGVDQNQ